MSIVPIQLLEAEDRATALRVEHGLGTDAIADVFAFLAHMGLQSVRRPMSNHGPDGMYVHNPDLPLIVVNSERRPGHQRFVACHELAHQQFDRQSQIDMNVLAGTSSAERRANVFASCLLMPRAGVDYWWQTSRAIVDATSAAEKAILFSRHFGMPYEATISRLEQLGKFRSNELLAVRQVSPEIVALRMGFDLDRERWEMGRIELPPEYVRLALRAYGAGDISDARLGELLYVPVGVARERAREVGMTPDDESLDVILGSAIGS